MILSSIGVNSGGARVRYVSVRQYDRTFGVVPSSKSEVVSESESKSEILPARIRDLDTCSCRFTLQTLEHQFAKRGVAHTNELRFDECLYLR